MEALAHDTTGERQQWVVSLAQELTQLHDEHTQSHIRPPDSAKSNWASELGHPCDLYLTFRRVCGHLARPIDMRLQRIFEEGRKQEGLILRELEDMGITVLERGVPIASSDALFSSLNISGQIDAKCNFEAIAHRLLQAEPEIDWRRKRVVVECKSLGPHLFGRLVDYDALKTAKQHYVQKWADQMLLYLLGHNDEAGLFVFKSKVTGELRFVPVTLDLEECERLAQKAKRVNEAVARYRAHPSDESLPPPIAWRQDLCATCQFLTICPNSREIPSTELSDDPELLELLEQREALHSASRDYADVQETLDQRLERFKGTNLLIGDYQIRWGKSERKEKVLPAATIWRKTITKLPAPVSPAASTELTNALAG